MGRVDRMCRSTVAAMVLGVSAGTAAAETSCGFESGAARLPLLELYTSEGCSSCPPADRWLSRTFRSGGATPNVLPLAFHVDYWNRLGWPDRFSDARYSARQGDIAARNRSATVYTPQFVLDGRDVRPRTFAQEIDEITARARQDPPGATIRGQTGSTADGALRVRGEARLTQGAGGGRARAFVALYQNGLTSTVTAGENGGRTLHHDYVVRAWSGPFDADASGRIRFDVSWPAPAEFRVADGGVVVYVEDVRSGRTLQAVAGTVCPSAP